MSSVHSEGTKPEIIVRKWLWDHSFRYRVNHKRLPGHPDLVLRKYRTCIFVNGCFWHGHYIEIDKMESTKCCRLPSTNREFWIAKIRRNKERNKEEQQRLADMGVAQQNIARTVGDILRVRQGGEKNDAVGRHPSTW